MNSATVFSLHDVRYSYLGRFPAVDGVSLAVERGSRTALIGSNGSGKSTLLKLLDALYFADEGKILFGGQALEPRKFREDEAFAFGFRRSVGLLFQDPEVQLFSPTVWDEICFGPLQMRWSKEEVRDRAERVLRQFGLSDLRNRQPHRLSLGEKKRVALASVLVLDPEVLLLDEPTASLDPRTQSTLLELLYDWSHDGKTVITSTQNLALLREVADTVHVLQAGRLLRSGTPDTILGDGELLETTNLVHVHTHRHRDVEHLHPHSHDFHRHDHE